MKLYLSILFMALLLVGCKKKGSDTPAQPTEYFNCKIDGKYWSYKQEKYSTHDALKASHNQITLPGYEIMSDNQIDVPNIRINFWLLNQTFPDSDTVTLTSYNDLRYAELYTDDPSSGVDVFNTDRQHTGKIFFTSRTSNSIKGSFYFDALSAKSNTILHITEGNFSIIPQ